MTQNPATSSSTAADGISRFPFSKFKSTGDSPRNGFTLSGVENSGTVSSSSFSFGGTSVVADANFGATGGIERPANTAFSIGVDSYLSNEQSQDTKDSAGFSFGEADWQKNLSAPSAPAPKPGFRSSSFSFDGSSAFSKEVAAMSFGTNNSKVRMPEESKEEYASKHFC